MKFTSAKLLLEDPEAEFTEEQFHKTAKGSKTACQFWAKSQKKINGKMEEQATWKPVSKWTSYMVLGAPKKKKEKEEDPEEEEEEEEEKAASTEAEEEGAASTEEEAEEEEAASTEEEQEEEEAASTEEQEEEEAAVEEEEEQEEEAAGSLPALRGAQIFWNTVEA